MNTVRRIALLIIIVLGVPSTVAAINITNATVTPFSTNAAWELNTTPSPSYSFLPVVRQHPLSGETLVMWKDDRSTADTLQVAVLKADGTLSTPLVAPMVSGNIGQGNHDITPGPANEWLWTWYCDGVTPSLRQVMVLSTTEDSVTQKTGTNVVNPDLPAGSEFSNAITASWNTTLNQYLVSFPSGANGVAALTAVLMDRNGNILDTELVSNDITKVKAWPAGIDVAPTGTGWLLVWNGPGNIWSATVQVNSGQLTTIDAGPEIATTSSGTVINPSLAVTPNGYVAVFRHSAGSDQYIGPFSVRARWFDNAGKPIGQDVVIATSIDSISAPKIAASGTDLMVTWNGKHNSGSGNERVLTANVSVDGSTINEPVAIHTSDFSQLRSSITWNRTTNQYQVIWVQKNANNNWNLWTNFVSGPLTPDLVVPAPDSEAATATTTIAPTTTTVAKKVKKQDTLPATGKNATTFALLGVVLIAGGLVIAMRRRLVQ